MNRNIIRELLRKHAFTIASLLLIAVGTVLLSVITIELGRRIINLISEPSSDVAGKREWLMIYCLGLFAAAIVSGAVDYGLNVMYSKFSQSFVNDIRIRLFDHLLRLPQDFFNKNSVGQISNKIMNEIGNIGNFLSKLFLTPVIHFVMLVFYGVYLFNLNWKLAIAGVIFMPLCVIILPKLNKRMQTLTDENINISGNMTGYFQDVFTGIIDIRASQTYFFEKSRLKEKIRKLININLNMAKTTGVLEAMMITITQLAPLSIYFYGGILCLNNEMTAGTLVASIVVIDKLFTPVNYITNFIMDWRQVSVRFDMLDKYFQLEPEKGVIPSGDGEDVPVENIKFDGVKFGFTEDQLLLNDISFEAGNGEKVAFVGPSGSGKSLTAALLGTIYRPLGGKITIGGKMAHSLPLHYLRKNIGYVNQTLFLFNDTIRNNIIYSLLRRSDGNTRIETWIDFSLLDNISDMEALNRRIIEIIKEVGLFEDIINIGLRSKPGPLVYDISQSDKDRIVDARNELARKISNYNSGYVEFYREDKFLEYCTVFENIVFCPTEAITENFGSVREFCKEHLYGHLNANGSGLTDKLLAAGLKLARADIMLLEKLREDKSGLLDRMELSENEVRDRIRISEKLAALGMDADAGPERIDPALREEILDLVLKHSPGMSKENVLDDVIRKEILAARRAVQECLAGLPGRDIAFYDHKKFNESLSLMENIIFGTVNPSRKKANEEINILIGNILKQAGLEDLVVRRGLEFHAGERGARLSGGQKQKIVIARILLKNPAILILDEATAALDAASQARINDVIAGKYKDRTVISIAHRLNIIRDYDEIIVFDKGRIVERGAFEDLLKMNGLFSRLYEGSN